MMLEVMMTLPLALLRRCCVCEASRRRAVRRSGGHGPDRCNDVPHRYGRLRDIQFESRLLGPCSHSGAPSPPLCHPPECGRRACRRMRTRRRQTQRRWLTPRLRCWRSCTRANARLALRLSTSRLCSAADARLSPAAATRRTLAGGRGDASASLTPAHTSFRSARRCPRCVVRSVMRSGARRWGAHRGALAQRHARPNCMRMPCLRPSQRR
jgi:hypothetical protein